MRLGAITWDTFWQQHARNPKVGQRRALALAEAQYYRHIMFASCAWFFEDLDRIEPRNAIRYGLRALREAESVHKLDLLTGYTGDLRGARSSESGRSGADLLADVLVKAPGGRLWVAPYQDAGHEPLPAERCEPHPEKWDRKDSVVVA